MRKCVKLTEVYHVQVCEVTEVYHAQVCEVNWMCNCVK